MKTLPLRLYSPLADYNTNAKTLDKGDEELKFIARRMKEVDCLEFYDDATRYRIVMPPDPTPWQTNKMFVRH
jgi:hypothetical protein